jgi:monoamine oxidase
VVGLLQKRLKLIPESDIAAQAEQWDLWTDNWSQFSLGAFLRSNLAAIKSLLQYDDIIRENDPLIKKLDQYLPWPEIAVTAYTVFNYTLALDVSLVTYIQDSMGKWWSDKMHSLEGGLSALPDVFATKGEMEQHITYNRTVMKVEYTFDSNKEKSVKVSGVVTSSNQPFSVEGRSVIITVPLHVLRGIQIVNSKPKGEPFPIEFLQAIQDISYSPSTKIMLQYKQQFWNSGKNPENDITGGFSKTNLPLGQLHYPTEVLVVPTEGDLGSTWVPSPVTPDQPGILMSYTWKAEALLWGALSEDQAIALAVDQVDQVHPDIDTKPLFQVGNRQAWASDPTTLGAFAILRPQEYISIMFLMQNSWRNVYFGGEAISFANGWIQGALESGLRAAYELFSDDQPK